MACLARRGPVWSLSFQEFWGHPHEIGESWNVSGIQFRYNVVVGPLSSLCSSHGLTHMLCLLLGLCLADGGGGGGGAACGGRCGPSRNSKDISICN